MNYIQFLQDDREALQATLRQVREELLDITRYLSSSKFSAPDADYVYVRTDILPKIERVRFLTCAR